MIGNHLKTIYIMLPSLMDEQVFDTINDAINKAEFPDRLSFGISLQGLALEKVKDIQKIADVRFCVLPEEIVYGIGATRSFLYGMYNNEDYILSLDCHSSFDYGWDSKLIERHQELPNSSMSIITQPLSDMLMSEAHIGKYGDPSTSEREEEWGSHHAMQYLGVDGLLKSGHLKKNYVTPHFIFAPGSIVNLGYPKNYIFGEEGVLLSLIFFCNGYDTYMLNQTYITTMPKDPEAIRKRSEFFSKLLPHSPTYLLGDKVGHAHSIDYATPRAFSSHLLRLSEAYKLPVEIEKEYMSLILFGKNKELNLNGLQRTISDFLDFHNTRELTIKRIEERLKSILLRG
jgi:Glycosyltransferase (GlcNAc)